jgi:hypothetical protein
MSIPSWRGSLASCVCVVGGTIAEGSDPTLQAVLAARDVVRSGKFTCSATGTSSGQSYALDWEVVFDRERNRRFCVVGRNGGASKYLCEGCLGRNTVAYFDGAQHEGMRSALSVYDQTPDMTGLTFIPDLRTIGITPAASMLANYTSPDVYWGSPGPVQSQPLSRDGVSCTRLEWRIAEGSADVSAVVTNDDARQVLEMEVRTANPIAREAIVTAWKTDSSSGLAYPAAVNFVRELNGKVDMVETCIVSNVRLNFTVPEGDVSLRRIPGLELGTTVNWASSHQSPGPPGRMVWDGTEISSRAVSGRGDRYLGTAASRSWWKETSWKFWLAAVNGMILLALLGVLARKAVLARRSERK